MNSEELSKMSDAAKNFYHIIDSILQPRGLNAAIIDAHKKIIDSYVERTDIDAFTKAAFVSSYKRIIKEYASCAKTIRMAGAFISEDAQPEKVEEDWFAFFFDKVKIVTNEAVLNMWSRILAGEVNKPGSFSRSLLHTLSIMSSAQAELFCNISRFCMYEYKNEDVVIPLIFIASNVEAYEDSRITEEGLFELENLGLIQCDFKDEFVFHKKKMLRFGNKVLEIYGDPDNQDKIKAGNVKFTDNGLALFRIVGESYKKYRVDILNFAITKLQRRNCKIIMNNKLVL